jgi:hypothetical protein
VDEVLRWRANDDVESTYHAIMMDEFLIGRTQSKRMQDDGSLNKRFLDLHVFNASRLFSPRKILK